MSQYSKQLTTHGFLTVIWLVLITVTLLNTYLAESADPTIVTTLIVCLTIAFKGPLVADYFMDLRYAGKVFRAVIYSYVLIIPLVFALVIAFPDVLRIATTF